MGLLEALQQTTLNFMAQHGQNVKIYAPATAVVAGNPLAAPYVLQNPNTPVQCRFETDAEAQEYALTLGIDAQRVANAILCGAPDGMVQVRGVIVDSRGRYWLPHQAPVTNEEVAGVISIKVLVVQQLQKPDGLP